jgi:hypothetical protein
VNTIKFILGFLRSAGMFGLHIGGGGGGGGQTTSTSNTSNIPEYAQPYVETMLGSTMQQLFTGPGGAPLSQDAEGNYNIGGFQPYKAYGGTYDQSGKRTSYDPGKAIAGFQPMQEQAQRGIAGMQLPGEYGRASQQAAYAGMGGMDVAGQANTQGFQNQVGGYMNPYMQQVLDPQLNELRRQYGITAQQQAGEATRAGAFGGSREAIMAAENNRNLGMAQNQAIGQAYDKSFGAAQQQYNQNLQNQLAGYGMMGQSASQLAGIGNQMLTGQQGIYNMQNTAGAQQQALEQRKLDQAMTDYANAQQYPLMQLGTMSNMLRGLPMQASTTNQYAAAPNALTQGIGAAGAAASLYNATKGPGGAAGGLPSEFKYAKGGITSVPQYNVGGEIESQLESMDIQGLMKQAQESSSPTVRAMAKRILREKQMEQSAGQAPQGMAGQVPQGMAGGGIIAFAPGGIAGANEGDAGEEEARIGMQERLARPPTTGDGIMGVAPAPVQAPPAAAPPAAPAVPADIVANAQNAFKTQQDIANKPIADIMAERQALRESMGVGENVAREKYRTEQMAERANLKDEAERQKNLRLAQFFASWGSTPGSTLAAGMTALQKSIPGMIDDAKDAKKAKRDADKIIYDLDNADRLEKMGRIDEATALKEKAADNAQKLNQNLLQHQTSITTSQTSAAASKYSADTSAAASKYSADRSLEGTKVTAERMARSARDTQDTANRRLDENERTNLQRNVQVAERALADTEKAVAAEKDKDFAYKAAATRASQTRGVTPKDRAAAQAEVDAKDAAWNTRITRAREDADLLKSQMREVNKRLNVGSAPPPASAESVKVGDKTYARPAGMTDAQWSDYKKSQGVK